MFYSNFEARFKLLPAAIHVNPINMVLATLHYQLHHISYCFILYQAYFTILI